jgi:macrodomain Ter protein organizer (MatP/YcbG family)
MARTKQSLSDYLTNRPTPNSPINLYLVNEYLTRAIRNKKILAYGNVAESKEAQDKFYKFSLAPNDNKFIVKYGKWVEQYLTDTEWEKCKTAVRQKVFAKKNRHQVKTFRISIDLWRKLRYYAEEKNLAMSEAIEEIIIAADKSLAPNKNNKAWLKGG